ncbi:MAG TPA: DUF488 family protein [Mycobacteriales bacterium]|nr:DUF488 family protein [Mycobacteriales bacterium]
MGLSIARVYDVTGADPTAKFLIDRLWPRGLTKAKAPFEAWLKEIAPSPDLRKWYSHEVEKYDEFARRYRNELASGDAEPTLEMLRARAKKEPVVLLTATKNLEHSSAPVLRDLLT